MTVKAIVRTELQEIQDRLRFGQGSESLLATSAGIEDVAFVQWTSLTSVMFPNKPGKQFTMIQSIEQLGLCKYKARPHWEKNYERVFRHRKCHVRDKYPASYIKQVLEMQERHDPQKVLSP